VTSQRTDPLQSPVEKLEAVVTTADGGDPVQWLECFGNALTEFWQGLCAHESATESPTGALATINSAKQDTAPTLDRQVRQLRLDHVQMHDNARDLMALVATLTCRCHLRDSYPQLANQIAGLRKAGHEMVCRAHDHREVENKLFLDCITTDIGAGD
jgi:hypothetical protein